MKHSVWGNCWILRFFSLYSKVINIKYKSQKYTRLRIKIIKSSIHDYTITLINREKKIIIFLRIEWSLFVKNWVHFTQEYIVSSLARILGQWFDVEDFVNVIFTSCWKRTLSIIWTTLNPLYPRIYCAKVWLTSNIVHL